MIREANRGSCGGNSDGWKTISGDDLCKFLFFLLFLLTAPDAVYLLSVCALTGAGETQFFPLSANKDAGIEGAHTWGLFGIITSRGVFTLWNSGQPMQGSARASFQQSPLHTLCVGSNVVCCTTWAVELWLRAGLQHERHDVTAINDRSEAPALKILLSARATSGTSVLSRRLHRKK